MLHNLLNLKHPRAGCVHGLLTGCCAGLLHAGRDAVGGRIAGAQQEGELGGVGVGDGQPSNATCGTNCLTCVGCQ